MFHKSIVLLICLVFTSMLVYAQENVWSWEDCIREALTNNPELSASRAQLKQSEAAQAVSRSALLPQISADLSDRYSDSNGSGSERQSWGVSAKQLIYDGAQTSNDVKSKSETVKISQNNYAEVSANIRFNIRKAYIQLLQSQEYVALIKSIAERRAQNLKMIQLRFDAGREHKGALLSSEAELMNAQFEVSQAERDLILKQNQLTKAIGLLTNQKITVQDSFDLLGQYDAEPNFELLVQQTPTIQTLALKKNISELALGSARAGYFPQVSLSSSTGQSLTEWGSAQDDWSVGVSVSVPLFEGGKRKYEVSKAQAAIEETQANERNGLNAIAQQLEGYWKGLQDALEKVTVAQKYLEATQERAKIANAQYSTGLISFDDWIVIVNNLVSEEKSFISAQANVLIAEAEWIQAKGERLEDE